MHGIWIIFSGEQRCALQNRGSKHQLYSSELLNCSTEHQICCSKRLNCSSEHQNGSKERSNRYADHQFSSTKHSFRTSDQQIATLKRVVCAVIQCVNKRSVFQEQSHRLNNSKLTIDILFFIPHPGNHNYPPLIKLQL